ncbi:hypothetical protein [Crenobacter cavernae]|uniref:Uncharacterized protein n=1 Tax=Crenobacter cavernae TaxID=2290923 RepID=A0ABY0FIA3_9NEIS|nr:hypothetical protein [Crenobacter cavernae]RXZ45438.1 hypothetical protein EBB06_01090 [Crenobacter cavernae]
MVAMIEATKNKLHETKFFLHLLVKESEKLIRNEPEAFRYYLSAFLSAARSVTFALQSEEKEKYDKLFSAWMDNRTEEERQLFKLFKNQRNAEQKQGGATVSEALEYIPYVEIRSESLGDPTYSFQWLGPHGTPHPTVGRPIHHFEFCGSLVEVTTLSKQYVDLLEQLVQDFMADQG